MPPFADLPPELIQKIFKHTVASPVIGSVRRTPWELGQVDHHTRRIAEATRELWSDVDFAPFGETTLSRVMTQLNRAGNGDLRVLLSASTWLADENRFSAVLDALSASSDQWTEASLSIHAHQMEDFPALLNVSRLRYLSIVILDDDYSVSYAENLRITCFGTAPALRMLQFHVPYHKYFHVDVPYAQLLWLSVYAHDSVRDDILPLAVQLEELEIYELPDAWTDQWSPPLSQPPLLLPQLRIMRPPSLCYLTTLVLPVLEELVVTAARHAREYESLALFLNRSPSTTITVLQLTELVSPWQFERLLADLPSVTTLGMPLTRDTNSLMSTLTIPAADSPDPVVAPALTHLILWVENVRIMNYTPVVRMVASRVRAGSPTRLRSLTLCNRPLPTHILAKLVSMEETGLTVVVNSTMDRSVRFCPLLTMMD